MNDISRPARALAAALEPFAAQVYFAPECHAAYEKLGFGGSPGSFSGVAAPDGAAYFCSRGSVMGQVPGQLIAAAFAVFNPAVVVPLVDQGWRLTDAATICAARDEGSIGQLNRILGENPEGLQEAVPLLERAALSLPPAGKPLYAGLASLDLPGQPLGAAWRLADMLREFRGDSHTAAWTAAGFNGPEIGLLTELYWGVGMRTYIRTRSWSEAELDAAQDSLEDRGLVAEGKLTDAGRQAREAVESATDDQCRLVIRALGDDLERLVAILASWSASIRSERGYPAAGPHDLAEAAAR